MVIESKSERKSGAWKKTKLSFLVHPPAFISGPQADISASPSVMPVTGMDSTHCSGRTQKAIESYLWVRGGRIDFRKQEIRWGCGSGRSKHVVKINSGMSGGEMHGC